jgi:hypothetical protein
MQRGWWSAELGVEASLPASAETAKGKGFHQRVVLGSLGGCAHLRVFSGCLVSKLGRVEVRGFGVDLPRSSGSVLTQLGPRIALGDRIGRRWVAALRFEALATLAPSSVELNQEEVWRTPALTLSAGLDVAAVFP